MWCMSLMATSKQLVARDYFCRFIVVSKHKRTSIIGENCRTADWVRRLSLLSESEQDYKIQKNHNFLIKECVRVGG